MCGNAHTVLGTPTVVDWKKTVLGVVQLARGWGPYTPIYLNEWTMERTHQKTSCGSKLQS